MNNIRELRKQKKLTINQISLELDLPFETYRSYEIGRRQADYDTLLKIADYFNVSLDYLLGREEFSPEERAAGFSETRKISITPIEDDMLYEFRQVGKKRGEEAQRALITIAKSMQ